MSVREASGSRDAGPSGEAEAALAGWAATMTDPLRARAVDAERARELPAATLAEAEAAGMLSMVMPVEIGGGGLGLPALAQTTRVLAHGCVSSAWTLSFYALHNWMVARGPQDFQRAVYGDGGVPRIPCPLAPTGVARPVEGGFVVRGRWEWATGVQHATQVMVHAVVEQAEGFDTRFVVLPLGEVGVDDVWHTSGMRATGSNTIVIDDVFVPAERSLSPWDLYGDPPGAALSDHPFLRHPVVPVLAVVASAPALGGAEAAVELFRERQSSRVLAYTVGERQIEQPSAQIRLAAATASVRAARLVWEDAIERIDAAAASGVAADPATLGSFRLAAAHVVRLSVQTLETILEGAGASVHFESSPIQRIARDLLTLRGHVIFDWDRTAQLAGKLDLGLEPGPTDLL